MKYITLREIIDDILLLVRNNNISESEDLSRALIAAWVNHHRRHIWRLRKDELKDKLKNAFPTIEELMALADDEFFSIKETGPHKLIQTESHTSIAPRCTEDTFENLFDNSWKSILAVHDEEGENIQYMNHIRRHYHNYRKYTFGEMTAYYDPESKKVFVQGLQDEGLLEYIYVLALYEVDDDEDSNDDDEDVDDPDEDDVKIPAWMIPPIKERIMKNELAFMLNRPSDDSNNATLASVKPHGPQDLEE